MAIVDLPANENARGQSVDIGEEKSPKDTPMAISIISKAAVFLLHQGGNGNESSLLLRKS